jgi:acyl-coenzyme A thioesterase PaaI-like protein
MRRMADRWRFSRSPMPGLLELAASVRDLLARLLVVDEGDPGLERDLAAAAESVREAECLIARHARVERSVWLGDPATRDTARPYYVGGPAVGPHNPVFPALELEHVDGVTRGSVTFDVLHEGPPGCVHGGVVSLLFDAVLGHHNLAAGVPGMTGTLRVRYRRPTPLYSELRVEANTVRRSGRKITSQGRLWAGEQLCAEADGLFILPRADFAGYLRSVQPDK